MHCDVCMQKSQDAAAYDDAQTQVIAPKHTAMQSLTVMLKFVPCTQAELHAALPTTERDIQI